MNVVKENVFVCFDVELTQCRLVTGGHKGFTLREKWIAKKIKLVKEGLKKCFEDGCQFQTGKWPLRLTF